METALRQTNNLIYLNTKDMSRPEWLKQRKNGIGGSDVAAVLGISPYKSAYKIWQDKVSDEVEQVDNKFTRWGNYLEEPIAEEYARENDRKVLRDNKIRFHKDNNCLLVNLDRVIVDNGDGLGTGVLECKSTVSFVYRNWKTENESTQTIPLEYYCQVQHELSVTGYKWAILAVLITDQREIKYIPIMRDEEYIEKQNKFLVMWWNAYVLQNEAPPMTAAEFNFSTPATGSTIDADKEITDLFNLLIDKDEKLKTATKEVDSIKDKIKVFMGENERLTIGGKTAATWKQINKKAYTVKETSSRQFKIMREN